MQNPNSPNDPNSPNSPNNPLPRTLSFSSLLAEVETTQTEYEGQNFVKKCISNLESRGLIVLNDDGRYSINEIPENVYAEKVRSDRQLVESTKRYLEENLIPIGSEAPKDIKVLYKICAYLDIYLDSEKQPKFRLQTDLAGLEVILEKLPQELAFYDNWVSFVRARSEESEKVQQIKKLIDQNVAILAQISQAFEAGNFDSQKVVQHLSIVDRNLCTIYDGIFTEDKFPIALKKDGIYSFNSLLRHHGCRFAMCAPRDRFIMQIILNKYNFSVRSTSDGQYEVYHPLYPTEQEDWKKIFKELRERGILKEDGDKIWIPTINEDFVKNFADKGYDSVLSKSIARLTGISASGYEPKLEKLISALQGMQEQISRVKHKIKNKPL